MSDISLSTKIRYKIIIAIFSLASLYFIYHRYYNDIPNIIIKNSKINQEFEYIDKKKIANQIENIYLKYNNLNIKKIRNDIIDILRKEDAISSFTIKIKSGFSAIIKIEEYIGFAIFQENGKNFLISQSGEIIKEYDHESIYKYQNLIIIRAENRKLLKNISRLFNLITSEEDIYNNLHIIELKENDNWNIIFHNDLIVKMSNKDFLLSNWSKFIDLFKMKGALINVRSVDLRFKDQIYILKE